MFADIGYGLSALAYFGLLLLLLAVRKSGLAKKLLILATFITSLWSLSHLSFVPINHNIHTLLLADSIVQWIWTLFLAACLKNAFNSFTQLFKQTFTLVVLILPTVAVIIASLQLVSVGQQYLLQTMIALQTLIILELLFRQSGDHKWAFKPLILYLGALGLFDFVTYANASMLNQLGESYMIARGYVHLALIPFLVLSIRRISHWGVDIFVSRDVVMHSTLLLFAGVYLFAMAAIGYLLRFIDDTWTDSVQIIFMVISLALLATVFFSSGFRANVKVFITKHFFANQFDYRAEWVKLTTALSENNNNLGEVYDTSLSSVLSATDLDAGAIVKFTKAGPMQVAKIHSNTIEGVDFAVVKKFEDFFQHQSWIIDIHELKVKPHQYINMKVSPDEVNQFPFDLILPVYKHENFWGMILIGGTNKPKKFLNWELRDYLNAVTAQVSKHIFQYENAKEIAENAQFAAFNRMSAFVLHDLKNVMAQIDLILCNAQQHKTNPEFIDDTFETLEYTKKRMDSMLKQLTEKKVSEHSRIAESYLGELIQHVIDKKCATLEPLPRLDIISDHEVSIDRDKFSNVIYHLINNAQQATSNNGIVDIAIMYDKHNKLIEIKITDSGSGMTQDFIDARLFKPFDTTKGNAGMGIGAYDAKQFIEELGGKLTVQSELGQGSVFSISIPTNEQ